MPRRDHLRAEPIDSNNPLFSGTASAGRCSFSGSTPRQREVPCCGHLRMLHIGATSSKFTVLTQVRSIGSTGATFGEQGPNLGPTWAHLAQHGATWPQLGPVWEQLQPKLSSTLLLTQRTLPAQSEILKTRPFTGVSHAFLCRSMRSPCWSQLREAVAKGSQVEHC